MADSKSDPQAKKAVIIAGDDGTLYHLSHDDLQAHKMDPSHPAHEPAKKLVETEKHGTLTPEHFTAQSDINVGINFSVFNMGGTEPPEK